MTILFDDTLVGQPGNIVIHAVLIHQAPPLLMPLAHVLLTGLDLALPEIYLPLGSQTLLPYFARLKMLVRRQTDPADYLSRSLFQNISCCLFIVFLCELPLNFVYSGHETFSFVFIRVLDFLWSNVSAGPTVRVYSKSW